jgi:hypothetical protein
MADFIIPDRAELECVLDSFGIRADNEDFEAALVMLAAGPAGGEMWKLKIITELPEDRIEIHKLGMIREGVWPGLPEWKNGSDDVFVCDLFAVTGKLRRIVYASGEIKYIDARQPQTDQG